MNKTGWGYAALLALLMAGFASVISAIPARAQTQPQPQSQSQTAAQPQPVGQALPPVLPVMPMPAMPGASQPPTPVPVLSIIPPARPVPAPVQPSFVETTSPPASGAAPGSSAPAGKSTAGEATRTLERAGEGIADFLRNPQKLEEAIRNAPQTVPQQFGVVKDRVTHLIQDPNRFNGNNFERLKWRNSLMFSPEQLARLYAASRGLTDQSVGAVIVEVSVPRIAPAFFLNSVLYNAPDNWTIWLNFRRIRSGASFPELEVARVDRDAVQFIWQTDQLDFLSPGWEKKVPPVALEPGEAVPEYAYRSKDGLIAVDRSRRHVKFTIGPHQSFVSRDMAITEGFVKSMFFQTVERIATPAPQGGASPIQIEGQTPPAAAPPAVETPKAPVAAPASALNPLNPLAPPAVMLQTPAR